MSVQEHNPEAKPLEGDDFYTVRIDISQIGAGSHEEAAVVFWRILRDETWPELFFEVENERTNVKRGVWIKDESL